ncbi:MAG: hypothetical protein ACLQU2_22305 [Candidatus Binataceae bacterium]
MLGEQTLGGSAQRMMEPSSSSLAFRYELGNFGLQTIPSASGKHEFVFGVSLLEAFNRATPQRQVGELDATNWFVNVQSNWEVLPNQLQEIGKELASSRYILELVWEDDEDGAPCTEETWSRAATLLAQISLSLFEKGGEKIDVPRILPGPNGSIDIHWDKLDYELLINIPADPKASATFYGDNREKSKIKGSFDSNREIDTALLTYRTLRHHPAK